MSQPTITKSSILIIDDEASICELLSEFLRDSQYDVRAVHTIGDARAAIAERTVDGVLIDQFLPDGKGMDLIEELRAANPDAALIMITGQADIPLAVEAVKRGADNFVPKPLRLPDLRVVLQKALEVGALRRKARASRVLHGVDRIRPDFGTSAAMRNVMEVAGIAADSDAPVLISGETGTGKGVLARWMHENGRKRGGLFVEVNCSALRGELLASELFGHARGAFTSAVQDRPGLLDAADGGTLLLDEIGDMDPSVQAQFLKVIEDKTYRRLGEIRERRSDFRLICATNRDLAANTPEGTFRKDLLYRIQVLPVLIPPLRERREDIPALARHLLGYLNYQYRDLAQDLQSLLVAYPWPGNVRELRNVLERGLLLARGAPLEPRHFPGLMNKPATDCADLTGLTELERLEMDSIKSALRRFDGDVNKAAQVLGISRATIFRRLKKYSQLSA